MARQRRRAIAKAKLELEAGRATPAPPVGRDLGPHGFSSSAWSAALVAHSSLAEAWIRLARRRGVPTPSRAETASEAMPANR
jgi:hypothetical protein